MSQDTQATEIAPRFCVIALNETEYYDEEWLSSYLVKHGVARDKLKCILAYYLYDANLQVHCCEVTPSYELHQYDVAAIWVDGFEPPENLESDFGGDLEFYYDTTYIHCHSIDNLVDKFKDEPFRWMDLGYTPDDWLRFQQEWSDASDPIDANGYVGGTREAYMAAAIEGVQGNAPI